jgi:predicted enzyme related to lactoylglutathione lyase
VSNRVDYFEIGTPDGEAAATFYREMFGWTIGEPSSQAYRMVNTEEGGIWDTSSMGGAKWAIFYVHVDDVEAAVRRATSLGATVVIPVTKGGALEFAHLADPDGNRFGVWRPVG